MIVRILTEGQYELDEAAGREAVELDHACIEAVQADDEQRFRDVFERLVDLVRGRGTQLEDDDLRHSELMLPPTDISFAEAQQDFTAEGLIPD